MMDCRFKIHHLQNNVIIYCSRFSDKASSCLPKLFFGGTDRMSHHVISCRNSLFQISYKNKATAAAVISRLKISNNGELREI